MSQASTITAEVVRNTFIDYFVNQRGHQFYKSSPVVPYNDPTLLFINAGMSQFKPIFLGNVEDTSPFSSLRRVVNSQKCIRAGGKHNDLDDVGKDVYHHTFFEMLGNWSFGDYFKKEAIDWAWDLLTNYWKLPPDCLYVTYFNGDPSEPNIPVDHEARELWRRYLPDSHILPFGCKENFWEMGDVGPCGPCSEIHFDRIGGGRDASSLVNQDDPDVLEIWNIVFMQYNREHSGDLVKLPKQCVDTGMGLERITSILQNKRSNYDTDLFSPIFDEIRLSFPGLREYQGKVGTDDLDGIDTAYRVVADHIRTLTVAISDGCLPSNTGRGYVLRRILRRGIRYGRQFLSAPQNVPWFSSLVNVVVGILGSTFPELQRESDKVKEIIKEEELQFNKTLDKGVTLFNRVLLKLQSENKKQLPKDALVFPGQEAFELYSTYGFPLDLTQLMAKEFNATVDVEEFEKAFREHQRVSQHDGFSSKMFFNMNQEILNKLEGDFGPTQDTYKYDWNSHVGEMKPLMATIQAIWDGESLVTSIDRDPHKILLILLDTTQFYAESGGQVADIGVFYLNDTEKAFVVTDVQKQGNLVFHMGYALVPLQTTQRIEMRVDVSRRVHIARNHTGTHILGFALRQILQQDCDQKGSLVEVTKARYDYEGTRCLTPEEVHRVENLVLSFIREKKQVFMATVPLEQARKINGLRFLTGEAYPDPVRVVAVGENIDSLLKESIDGHNISVEFCGGTHITNLSEMEDFVILLDDSVAKGIRRLTMATGEAAKKHRQYAKELCQRLTTLEGPNALDQMTMMKTELQKNKDAIPLLARKDLMDRLTLSTRSLMEQMKIEEKNLKKEAELLGKTLGKNCHDHPYLVYSLARDYGVSFKVMEAVVSGVKSVAEEICLFLISQTDTKLCVLVVTPESSSLNAKEWVDSVLCPLGGKSGGKSTTARGTISTTVTESLVQHTIVNAEMYIHEKLQCNKDFPRRNCHGS